jgi:NhaA family Na+:H+ antiporter
MGTHTHALDHLPVAHRHDRHLVLRLFRGALNRFLLLPIGAAIALVWANTEPESYFRLSQAWSFPVNEIAMAFFLALIAQELFEALMPGGALAAWRHRALAMVAALGGVIGSGIAFLLYVRLAHEMVLMPAWPVVAAVDIAAGYYLLRLIYARRSGPVAFLLLVAVMTDVVVMAVVSVQTPGFEVHPIGFGLLLVALGSAAVMRRRRVTVFWPYWLISGTLSWLSLYWMGIHPALALVPIVPLLPHDRRPDDVFADRPDDDPVHHAEHEWNGLAQLALFMFGLVNAGVILKHVDTGTWAVLVAALAGRPLGIIAAVALAVTAGLHLPRRMHWADVFVVALATTSGFTFALFLSSAVLPVGAVSDQVTLGALLTAAGALVTIAMARMLCVGRFKPRAGAVGNSPGPAEFIAVPSGPPR